MGVNLMAAAQDAVLAALKPLESDSTLPAGLTVTQHVPQDIKGPLVVIDRLHSAGIDGTKDAIELITVLVRCQFEGRSRAPLIDLLGAIKAALDGQEISLAGTGALFEHPRGLASEAAELPANNVTYLGLAQFEFHAWPG